MIGNPLGLLALLSIPTIIAIHYFRRRFQPRTIAGLFLWTDPDRDPSSGRRLHKIENRLSLWLELLLALVLSLYLLDFQTDNTAKLEHYVVVLDSTASMAAKSGDQDTAGNAREKIREILGGGAAESLVTIVLDSANPVVLSGPGASIPAALKALEEWFPQARGQNNQAALALAREIAGPDSTLHYVTDRDPGTERLVGIHWHAVGKRLSNGALITARRTDSTEEGQEDLFVVVASWGDESVTDLIVTSNGQTLKRESLPLDGKGTPKAMRFVIPKVDTTISIRLGDDSLLIDNQIDLDVPRSREVTFEIDASLSEKRATDIRKALSALQDVNEVERSTAHLVFGTGPRPDDCQPSAWFVGFGAFGDRKEDRAVEIELGPFLVERAHPLVRDVGFAGVVWPLPTGGGANFRPLVSAEASTLIGERILESGRDYQFNIDERGGNLGRSIAWPILMFNLVESRRNFLTGAAQDLVALGDSNSVFFGARGQGNAMTLIAPNGDERAVGGLRLIDVGPMTEVGRYRIRDGDRDWTSWQVHFRDRVESDLTKSMAGNFNQEGDAVTAEEKSDALLDPKLHFGLLLAGLFFFIGNALVIKGGRSS